MVICMCWTMTILSSRESNRHSIVYCQTTCINILELTDYIYHWVFMLIYVPKSKCCLIKICRFRFSTVRVGHSDDHYCIVRI